MISSKNSKKTADNLIKWIRDYAPKNIDSYQIDEQGYIPAHIFLDLGNQGFFGMHVTRKYGGLELNTFDMLRVLEQVAAIDLTLVLILIELIQGAHTLEKYASPAMKNLYLNKLASGRVFATGAMTESDAGSNPRAMSATAVYCNDKKQWFLNGNKRWVGLGSSANLIAVYVNQLDTEGNWQGMSGFLLTKGIDGLKIGAESITMGVRGFSKNAIHMNNVEVTAEHLLGKQGEGMEIAQDNMMYIRLCLAAASIGAKKKCLQLMYRYAKQRLIATGYLLDNPVSLVRLSEMTAAVEALDNFVYLIARFYDEMPSSVPEEVFVVAKMLSSETLGWVADLLIQMLGARGYEEASGISKIYRDARAFRIFEGPTEALNMYLGSKTLEKNSILEFFFCNILKQKKQFEMMQLDIEKVKNHCVQQKKKLFAKPFSVEYWTQFLVGEIASYGFLLAFMQYKVLGEKSDCLNRSLIWVQSKYKEAVQKGLKFSCGEEVLIPVEIIETIISNYTNAVGDLEQLRQSRSIDIDPLLSNKVDKSDVESQSVQQSKPVSPVGSITHKKIKHNVLQLFEEQVIKNPNATALVYQNVSLSYSDINNQAITVANHLRGLGVKKNKLVAIYFERSIEMIIALLGVFKAGGAYLPLDYNYPEKNLKFMFEDSGADIIFSHKKLANDIPFEVGKIIFIEDILDNESIKLQENTKLTVSGEDLAYVIYTSGSTGNPKGVMLQHNALSNLINCHLNNLPGERTVLQFTSLNFDMSFIEIFSALCSGGTLVLISEQDRLDIIAFSKVIKKYSVQQLILPVYYLTMFAASEWDIESFRSLKEIITAGEQLTITPAILDFFEKLKSCRLLNYYGPAETHVVTGYKFPSNTLKWPTHAPIGLPIYNTKILILDEKQQPVPAGKSGEIYIGGVSLAKGYVNRHHLTQEKFIADPWGEDILSERLYKTGDLGKYLPDNNIMFLGRIDDQIKIRGFRIEPQEIEFHLSDYPGVEAAVVVAKKGASTNKHLEAYVVLDNVSEDVISKIHDFLKKRLPLHMMPAKFNVIDQMPLTNSGKINRKVLEEYHEQILCGADYTDEQMTTTEKRVLAVIEGIFKSKIKTDDSFMSIGGNSLLAMHVVSILREEFSVEIPAYSLLSDPTIGHTARRIDLLLPT